MLVLSCDFDSLLDSYQKGKIFIFICSLIGHNCLFPIILLQLLFPNKNQIQKGLGLLRTLGILTRTPIEEVSPQITITRLTDTIAVGMFSSRNDPLRSLRTFTKLHHVNFDPVGLNGLDCSPVRGCPKVLGLPKKRPRPGGA